ncbi:MAG: CinA family nicotinamide mononucleotide deamidase-related protein [Anaerolineales bacterium]
MNPPQAEILTIGTEILLGQIVDTNTAAIARSLRKIGVNLFFAATVGDNVERSADAIRTALNRSDIIITTGGLGPTIDDMTRVAMAQAIGAETEFSPDLWDQIQERFSRFGRQPGENNRRQAYIPVGAHPIVNPIGTAPAFWLEQDGAIAIALPGVPAEMEHLLEHEVLPLIKGRFSLGSPIYTRILRTAGIGESALDAKVQDLEAADNPTLGLSAHPGRVDLRLGARADSESEAETMLSGLEEVVRQRLGDVIYGVDEDTLETIVMRQAAAQGWKLVSVEAATGGALATALSTADGPLARGLVFQLMDTEQLRSRVAEEMESADAQVGVALALDVTADQQRLVGITVTPAGDRDFDLTYGGPPASAAQWGLSQLLNLTRLAISQD